MPLSDKISQWTDSECSSVNGQKPLKEKTIFSMNFFGTTDNHMQNDDTGLLLNIIHKN